MAEGAAVVQQAYEAFGKGDIPAVLGLLDEAVEWSVAKVLPQGGDFHGRDGVLAFFQGLGAAWDPLGLEIEAVSDLGDGLVAGVIRGAGKLRGADAFYTAVHLFTVAGGRITRFREYVLDAPPV